MFRSAPKFFQRFCPDIGGMNQAVIFHEIGEMQTFSSRTATGIPPSLSGFGFAEQDDPLRSQILDLIGVVGLFEHMMRITGVFQ